MLKQEGCLHAYDFRLLYFLFVNILKGCYVHRTGPMKKEKER